MPNQTYALEWLNLAKRNLDTGQDVFIEFAIGFTLVDFKFILNEQVIEFVCNRKMLPSN